MSDDTENNLPVQDELASLKARADALGVTYHPSIGLEKLREKVNAAITSEGPKTGDDEPKGTEGSAGEPVEETLHQRRLRLKKDAMRLVRIRVQCMNPAKKEWEGELFTFGNSFLPSVTKYVPFSAEDGWHVPHCIYEQIKERQCQIFINAKDARGNKIRKGKMIREFAVEVLDPLTQEELHDLAQRQAMAKTAD